MLMQNTATPGPGVLLLLPRLALNQIRSPCNAPQIQYSIQKW